MERLRHAKLEVRTHAQLMPTMDDEMDSLRTWLISVQTFVSDRPVHIDAVASNIEIVLPTESVNLLDVEYLGLVDPSIALYRLEELEPTCSLTAPHHVRVKLVPKFSSSVYNFYMLDDILTSLVGKRYLLHPKYALTLVLAYARQHNLVTEKFIICDSFLATMFGGAQWVKIKSLWNQIVKLISPVSPANLWNTVNFESSVADQELCKPSLSSLEVSIGSNSEMFPGDWPSCQSRLSRTTSSPCITESSTSGSSSTSSSTKSCSGVSKSSSRSLRRHKTL